jgi:hypothetical protein
VNDLDPQAVIVTKRIVATETFPDDTEFYTGPLDIEAVMLESALRVRTISFYTRVGPRRSAKPLPALTHLAPVAVVPKATQFDLRTLRISALWLVGFAVVSALAVWAVGFAEMSL